VGRRLRGCLHQGLHVLPLADEIWVNGHGWAKQQARKAGLGFTELSKGFASCEDPALLQRICDVLQPGTIEVFFQRWLARLPLPLGPADQDAGYWWELSTAQVEVSRTIVFDAPRHARAFFEALVTDNLDLGRPDTIEIIFDPTAATRCPDRHPAPHRRPARFREAAHGGLTGLSSSVGVIAPKGRQGRRPAALRRYADRRGQRISELKRRLTALPPVSPPDPVSSGHRATRRLIMAYIPPLLEQPLSHAPKRKGTSEGPHLGQILAIAVVVGFTLFLIAIVTGGGGQA
jgi:hypothetical protein